MMRNIRLESHLKAWKNIAWYPACYLDFSFAHLLRSPELEKTVPPEDLPDCLLMTDGYTALIDELFTHKDGDEIYRDQEERFCVRIFNVRQLANLRLPPPDSKMLPLDADARYGQVYTADLVIEDRDGIKCSVLHLVYAFCENFAFFTKYIKDKIPILYLIHYNWGFGSRYDGTLPYLLPAMSGKYYLGTRARMANCTEIHPDFADLSEELHLPSLKELGTFRCGSERDEIALFRMQSLKG